jgi:A/G-specific adenine glycosylase
MAKYFTAIIQHWYDENKRDLPWRNVKDPYQIWLSEIILQQTKVEQGLPYYEKFLKEFPEITDLALAPVDDVLKLWQGLGYYSRAKNLHHTAKEIVRELNGSFPAHYQDLVRLRGIGDYTASAILSFAFDKPWPVVDGNVIRVITRYFGVEEAFDLSIGKQKIRKIAEAQLDRQSPANYNQSIMEFGALQCVPQKPDCSHCPLVANCYAYAHNRTNDLPFKSIKTRVKPINYHFAVVMAKTKTFLVKRGATGIWSSMYQFPLLENTVKTTSIKSILANLKEMGMDVGDYEVKNRLEFKHLLSHRKISATFWEIDSKMVKIHSNSSIFEMEYDQINRSLAIPKLIEKYLDSKS